LFREPWGVSTTTSMSTADSFNNAAIPGLLRHTQQRVAHTTDIRC
jgi:hypothetical protein